MIHIEEIICGNIKKYSAKELIEGTFFGIKSDGDFDLIQIENTYNRFKKPGEPALDFFLMCYVSYDTIIEYSKILKYEYFIKVKFQTTPFPAIIPEIIE